MSAGFATRWPVLQRHAVAATDLDEHGALRQDVLERWVADVCAEYVGRCTTLPPGAIRQRPVPPPAGRLAGRLGYLVARATRVRRAWLDGAADLTDRPNELRPFYAGSPRGRSVLERLSRATMRA